MRILSVTLTGSSNQQVTTQTIYASVIVISSSGTDYLGDDTVSATNGQKLSTTPIVIPAMTPRGIPLSSLWVIGSSSDKINLLYEPSA